MKLRIAGMEKSFGSKQVLDNLQYTFEQGRIYGLLGRNGAGKTTLFNCLSGEIRADGGKVLLEDSQGLSRELQPEDIGYVFSLPILPEFLTGYEFVRFYMDLHPNAAKAGQTPESYLDLVRLSEEDRYRLIKDYSHGMKNKIQILCFLIAKPPVILLDEPLTSFDVVVAHEMKQLLLDIKKDHILIFSTHLLQLAAELCDDAVLLNKGTLTPIAAERLKDKGFEAELVELLKEESHG
ncbi:ABC transporter ATP-binding protein [Gorillibacterium sp. CAU 1737]|uniref:ABC transporter ATP-binding protein n=1 Tax=Gorillibacterium sp. CAU 1737 TaxID=3140362 RepID=UPI0032610D1C